MPEMKCGLDCTASIDGSQEEYKELHSRTPDSPESARAVAPKSPISPRTQHTNLTLQRSSNGSSNGSISPIQKAGSQTPPHTSSASTPLHLADSSKELSKLRRFLGALYQFGQDTSNECGERVRSLIVSLVSTAVSIDDFKQALQESVNFPLRPYVLPFLKSHVPLLKRDIANSAKANNQTIHQYVRSNESSLFEFVSASAESSQSSDIFMPGEAAVNSSNAKNTADRHQSHNGSSRLLLKRRTSEGVYDHQNGLHEWSEYMLQAKRPHMIMNAPSNGHMFTNYSSLLDYASGPSVQIEPFASVLDKNNLREEREMRAPSSINNGTPAAAITPARSDVHRTSASSESGSSNTFPTPMPAAGNRIGGEEEWKNIHTMLNCISAMVDKTKRAITILQQRGIDTNNPAPSHPHADISMADIKRQTEEKISEFRRNAEEAVNQVKRQALIEIQRAVAAAENRAIESMAQERLKLEKMFADYHKSGGSAGVSDETPEELSPPVPASTQNTCWNCGRKANETCSGCNTARYCGSFCQHKDWETHHQVCGTSVRSDGNGLKRSQPVKLPTTHASSPPQPSQSSTQAQPQTASSSLATAK